MLYIGCFFRYNITMKVNKINTKILSILVIIAFILNSVFTGVSSAETFNSQTLSPQLVNQKNDPPERATEVISEIKFLTVAFAIADHFLDPNIEKGGDLRGTLREKFHYTEDFLAEQVIDLNSVFESKGIVTFAFEKNGRTMYASICGSDTGVHLRAADPSWEIIDKYAIHIFPEKVSRPSRETDIKGQEAPETDPLIQELIKKGRVVEVSLDEGTDKLNINRVRWVENYHPLLTPPELYLDQEISPLQVLTELENLKLRTWMKANRIRGSPVKIRIALGRPALGWTSDVEHSNIAHAGVRDGVIYIGGMLLQELLKQDNAELFAEVFDRDEMQHLSGHDHGTAEECHRRLQMVGELIENRKLEKIRQAMITQDVYFLRDELRRRLGDPGDVFDLFGSINDFVMSRPLYPVESTYPIKKAIAALSREEQERLEKILTNSLSVALGYRSMFAVDDVLLMLADAEKIKKEMKDWIAMNAPELQGRSLWQISPEIWHEAGGLARVMQYHGAAILELIGIADVRLRHVEPHYQNRIDAHGEAMPLDYTNGRQLTHPVVGGLEEVDNFTVTVGGKAVNVLVSRGVNDLGIEVFLIRDVQEDGKSYYTHSLYNYRNPWEQGTGLPTWEEFSVFYSKASLEFVRRYERGEREKLGEAWKAPVMHLNDSQVALVSVYRKILFDAEKAKNEKNPSHIIDPVLEHATVAFSTHTYGNRKVYDLENGFGDSVMDFMEIPKEYRDLLRHEAPGWRAVYDMASGGLRTSDWQGAVSRAHRDDVSKFDEWINTPSTSALANIFKKFLARVRLIAVSNGDHRENSAVVFREILEKLYGDKADPEHPTPEQVREVKKAAKEQLRLASGQVFYTTCERTVEEGPYLLDPDQPVVSYSGRLVPEKAGRKRAFTNENIKKLLAMGVQVVIYGNVQANNSLSDTLKDELIALVEEIKKEQAEGKQYAGRLIFVPRFSLKDQRALLAATDIQVQDSDPETEAAGYTEADVSSCGGLELAPYRDDNYVGEGLLAAQGMPIDLNTPGAGNTLVPANGSPEAYFEILKNVLDLGAEKLSHYQATSVRFSRILDARLTAAAYLREFSKAVSDKRRREKEIRILEEMRKKDKESMTLLSQVTVPNPVKDPKEYAIYKVSRLVTDSETEEAMRFFFSSPAFQGRCDRMDVPTEILNRLIYVYDRVRDKDKNTAAGIKSFIRALKERVTEFSEDPDVSKALQLITGQALTIISWMDRKVYGAEQMRLTTDDKIMAANEKRGRSYLDSSKFTEAIKEIKEEGGAGFYWRGTEGIKKLGPNVAEGLMYSKDRFEKAKDKTVLYLMDHGFIHVPEPIKELTAQGKISTIHETFFLNDFLPGSFQCTSTGAGHFQGMKLDVKQVTEGWGIQLNVLHNPDGSIARVYAQEVKKGDWTFALPGCKDYVVNLGGLRFNDFSVELTPEQAGPFLPGFDFGKENLARVKEAAEKDTSAPYLAGRTGDEPFLLKNGSRVPDIQWVPKYGINTDYRLITMYPILTPNGLAEQINVLSAVHASALKSRTEQYLIHVLEAETATADAQKPEPQAITDIPSLKTFIDDNADFLTASLGAESGHDVLLRLPVELVEIIGVENLRGFLETFQATAHGYVELYSTDRPEGVSDAYGLVTKALPESLEAKKRSRGNTVTLFPVFKGEELPASKNKRWGGEDPKRSIIAPVGYNYDSAGLVRSIILGLRLSEIARDDSYTKESYFVSYTLSEYMALCLSYGQDSKQFDLTTDDLINMARGDLKIMVESLNKVIKLLPIMPVDTEHLREVFEHTRQVLIRA